MRKYTSAENKKNKSMQSNNTSGFTGVQFDKRSRKYVVGITINGKGKHLGYFCFFEDAVSARIKANYKYDFYFDVELAIKILGKHEYNELIFQLENKK